MPRKERGREFASTEDSVYTSIRRLEKSNLATVVEGSPFNNYYTEV